MQNDLHQLLIRQLKKTNNCVDKIPELNDWQNILSKINESYNQSDQERYLLERSLSISSKEMQELHNLTQQHTEQWIKDISSTYPDMLLLLSEDGIVLDLLSSTGFENLLINADHQDINQPIEFILTESLSQSIREHIGNISLNCNSDSYEFFLNNSIDNTVYEIRLIATKSHKDNNLFCLIRDISDLVESKNKLKYLAHHDSLTGLPNRLGYYKKLNQILKRNRTSDNIGAVLFFDLDRFKSINDSLGHRIGDQLIEAVANRIPEILKNNEFFARMSGDEFTILIYDVENENKIHQRAHKILQAFTEPFDLDTQKIEVKASIGISLFPKHGTDSDILTQFADTAMYSAKDLGGNQLIIFNEKQNSSVTENFQIEQGLRRAIDRNEMYMVYQPQICVQSQNIIGYEALIRWQPINKQNISPMKFIPIAELTGYIDELGMWIINNVFEQIVKWKINNFAFHKISINISRFQLHDPKLTELIFLLMKKYKINHSEIVFEITEDSIISNNKVAINNVMKLNEVGISIAIDDFGTGYSSFSDLKNIPFSNLKIDKSIIDGIGKHKSDDAIVRAIIAIGNEMNMKLVAEGVETQEQFDFLKMNHCHTIQGYLFSKPLKVVNLDEMASIN
ncbi:MAG: putative bifunctional diguanylate cyclase/phosphodiesterase [Marinicellaceae bacterium]